MSPGSLASFVSSRIRRRGFFGAKQKSAGDIKPTITIARFHNPSPTSACRKLKLLTLRFHEVEDLEAVGGT